MKCPKCGTLNLSNQHCLSCRFDLVQWHTALNLDDIAYRIQQVRYTSRVDISEPAPCGGLAEQPIGLPTKQRRPLFRAVKDFITSF
ncbi:hypothetical protein [Agrilactobacillus composti]|uniref:hypothetical protein n=1 Tax=Agrilactobacillus composti TaxID=398555 RepID=UPI00055823DA|nr:hypothetical protein [Agrilactobacillus composti]